MAVSTGSETIFLRSKKLQTLISVQTHSLHSPLQITAGTQTTIHTIILLTKK